MVTMSQNQQLLDIITSLDVRAPHTAAPCIMFLDDTAGTFAASKPDRYVPPMPHSRQARSGIFIRSVRMGDQEPSIWLFLGQLWRDLSDAQATADEDGRFAQNTDLVLSLARFTRNLVADVRHNQQQAL